MQLRLSSFMSPSTTPTKKDKNDDIKDQNADNDSVYQPPSMSIPLSKENRGVMDLTINDENDIKSHDDNSTDSDESSSQASSQASGQSGMSRKQNDVFISTLFEFYI